MRLISRCWKQKGREKANWTWDLGLWKSTGHATERQSETHCVRQESENCESSLIGLHLFTFLYYYYRRDMTGPLGMAARSAERGKSLLNPRIRSNPKPVLKKVSRPPMAPPTGLCRTQPISISLHLSHNVPSYRVPFPTPVPKRVGRSSDCRQDSAPRAQSEFNPFQR